MKSQGLTAKQVQHIGPGAVRFEVPAGPPSGLYLVIYPSGSKSWALRYRHNRQTRKLTFAQNYPEMSLAAARAEAEAKLSDLENGIDPAAVQAVEQEQQQPNSAKSVAEEWLERAVKGTATHGEVKRILNKDVLPEWKHKTITDIGKPDVLRLLDSIVDRPAPVLANRTFSILRRWFNWTVERGYLEVSPLAGLRLPTNETSRDRVLTDDELSEIWNAAPELGFPFGEYFRFLILTAQRRNEVATIQWAHLDLANAMWTLPRESTKARRIHDVPLSKTAVTLAEEFPKFKGSYVFTTTSGDRPVSGFSKAKAALDAIIQDRRKERGIDEDIAAWTIHDLRRTAATWMAKNGTPPHVLAAILNHTPGSTMGVTSIYNRFRYTEERRAALEAWAEYVVSLEEKEKPEAQVATA
jgi:integrase